MQGTRGTAATRESGRVSAVRKGVLPLILVISLFFLWGVANNLNDILIRQFKKAFELSDLESGLVQSAFYLGYFLFAIPAGLLMRRYGYKAGIVVGLALYATGAFLFYPAADLRTYGFFLFALFVIASGLSFLETSANPFVTVLGSPEGAERRLNFAQAFNPLGSITGVVIGRFFIFSDTDDAPARIAAMSPRVRAAYDAAQTHAVQAPYVAIGAVVLALALLMLMTRFPAVHEAHEPQAEEQARWRDLRGRWRFFFAVAAQFFYVGAQVGVWSYLIRYAEGTVPGTVDRRAADYLIVSLVLFMLGRFAGAALMRRIAPVLLLATFAAVNTLLAAVAIAMPGHVGLYALIASSFFMSVMFPTIFALGVSGLGEARKLASSVLVMAIVGGAVLTPAMGALSGIAGINGSMAVPLVCFAVVLAFAVSVRREPRQARESPA
ncbi:MAG TPA: L-fucose:H+ symporter permease [Steroidobacteraceae bacterium]|jgi:FHS family L-fucose permease-like MFS transporter|nr:L-fucose:H+ symporter permease [Steroidobacteraceae bacterium]